MANDSNNIVRLLKQYKDSESSLSVRLGMRIWLVKKKDFNRIKICYNEVGARNIVSLSEVSRRHPFGRISLNVTPDFIKVASGGFAPRFNYDAWLVSGSEDLTLYTKIAF